MSKKHFVIGIILLFLFSSIVPIVNSNEENTINTPSQSKLQVIGGWEKWFGGEEWDEGRSVQQTVDGGYIITGITASFGAGYGDCYLIKTNKNGNKQWEKTFGGTGSDLGYSVLQTTDGGYIVVGTTDSFGVGHRDAWLIKTDSNGNIQWDKTYGGEEGDEQGFSVNQTADGGFIIAGYTSSFGAGYGDCYLVKTDVNGNLQWEKTFGGIHWDHAYSVHQTTDGGYILAGDSITDDILSSTLGNKGTEMVWLIKTDSNGNKQWDKKCDEDLEQGGRSVQQTTDGGYIVCGYLQTGTSENSVWLIKTDSNGNKQWDKKYGGEEWDEGQSVQQTSDGGYIITGSTQSFGAGKCDVWVIKTDSNGNIQWDKTFGGGSYDAGYSVRQTSDGGYIVTGNTRSFGAGYWDVYLIKMDSDGNEHPNKPIINGPGNGKTSETCYYSISTTDPNDDEIFYYIDWGDLNNTGWIGPYSSGKYITANHNWSIDGTYLLKVKSKDIFEAESEWATLEVSMPKNKVISYPIIRFLEQYIHLFPKLRQILDNEAPTQQDVGYLPIGLIDMASGDSSQSLQAAGYLNENETLNYDDICNQSMFEVFDIVEIGRNSWGLTSADFNDDGYIDFAVASAHTGSNYSTISIFYNEGNITFTRNDVYSTDFYLRYIKDLDSGDFDNDGDIDLIFTYSEYEYFNEIPVHVYGVTSLLLNDGNDSFSDEEIIARRGSGIPFDPEGRINPQLTTGDYDGDGDIDLLVGDNSGIVEFYLNDGSSNFVSAGIIYNFGHSSWGLTSGDFDGDGLIDFIVAAELGAHQAYGHYYLKSNNGLSSCFDQDIGKIIGDLSFISASLTSFDYDNDGDLDFIAGIWNEAFLFVNHADIFDSFLIGRFPDDPWGEGGEMLTYGGLTSADYNNDGYSDFITGGHQGNIRLFINNGNKNIPPKEPIIKGPTSGKAGEENTYKFIINDLNDDDVHLYIDWGNDKEEWIGPYNSGEEIILSHSWDKGDYFIRAKAKDAYGDESDWATLSIHMTKVKQYGSIWDWLLEKSPLLERFWRI